MKTQARDMTEGSIAKNIILFYIPLAIGGLFQQLYSFVDSVVVGRGIGAQALAAVGATSIVVWLTLGFAMGITKGFCIHISQAYGKKDYHLVNRGFFVASVLSLIVGTMISIVGSLAIRDFLILMHTPGEILEQSLDYIKVILLGFVITVLNNLFMSVLQSLGDSSTPFCALLVSSITNAGVDMRATMDIDTTVKALPLNEADVQRIIEEICNIPLEDNVRFQIKSTRTIMEEFDYPGIRVMLEATLNKMFYTMHFLPPVKSGKLFLARIILKLHYI